jgi:hypothetical protein
MWWSDRDKETLDRKGQFNIFGKSDSGHDVHLELEIWRFRTTTTTQIAGAARERRNARRKVDWARLGRGDLEWWCARRRICWRRAPEYGSIIHRLCGVCHLGASKSKEKERLIRRRDPVPLFEHNAQRLSLPHNVSPIDPHWCACVWRSCTTAAGNGLIHYGFRKIAHHVGWLGWRESCPTSIWKSASLLETWHSK